MLAGNFARSEMLPEYFARTGAVLLGQYFARSGAFMLRERFARSGPLC